MTDENPANSPPSVKDEVRPMASPLVFISHDSRDAELAEAFSKLLSSVSAGVLKSFRSSDRKGSQGIEYGLEWYPELMSKLSAASDVVCLLTQRSLDRPWLLYEAGVAKGRLNTPVYGIALGITLSQANSGPFAQFQNCDGNEDSLTKLVIQLVRRIPNSEPDQDAVKMQVQTFTTRAAKVLETLSVPKESKEKKTVSTDTSVVKLFEEVKLMFQELSARLESRVTGAPEAVRRRWTTQMNQLLMEELSHRLPVEENDPVGILVAASMFREEVPWLYELGMEAYRTAKAGDRRSTELAIMRFQHATDVALHGPWFDEMGVSKATYLFLRELPMLMDRFVHQSAEGKTAQRVFRRRTKLTPGE